jgi:CDP-6-deoxy-D-xylo-4-hexulose-3-dehydrase
VQLGARPVFCDSDHARYVPSAEAVLAVITPKTKAIFLPNLIGSKPDWEALRASPKTKGILLIEDSCDTLTHTPCTDMAVTSFYASHIITAGGGGGMVMFNTEEHKKRALMFRDWGRIGNNTEDMSERFGHSVDGIPYDFKFLYGVLGYNFKSTEMNAAFGNVQFAKLPKFRKLRQDNVAHYCKRLQGTSYVLPKDADKYDWLAMPLMHKDRKNLLNFLEQHEVQTRVCFAGNVTRHPAYRQFLHVFPEADHVMAEGFLLGAHHGVTPADLDRVCDLLIEYDQKWQASQKKRVREGGGRRRLSFAILQEQNRGCLARWE